MNIIKRLYSGRISGLTYLIGVLVSWGGFWLQGKVIKILPKNTFLSLISIAISLLIFIFFFSVITRRLHDLNKSGWLSLLIFVPIVNAIMGIILIFKPGSRGSNDYEKPPRNYRYLLQDLFGLS